MVIVILVLLSGFPLIAYAANGNTEVTGKVYEFSKDRHYEFPEVDTSEQTTTENTYGTFYISGNVVADGKSLVFRVLR